MSSTLNSVPFEVSLASELRVQASQFPDRPALWAADKETSYQKLLSFSYRIAACLQGVAPKPIQVGLLCYRSTTAYASIWGTLLAGSTYVPLNPKFPTSKTLTIVEKAECTALVVDTRCEQEANKLLAEMHQPVTVLMPEHSELPSWCSDQHHHFILCQDMPSESQWIQPDICNRYCYLLFTSGSTGEPKGVAVTHDNLRAYAQHMLQTYDFNPTDRFSQLSDLTFDLSVQDLLIAWGCGGCLYSVPETTLLCPADFIKKHQITCWNSVPSLLGYIKKFGKMKPDSFPHIRYSIFCGEPLPLNIAREWQKACPNGQLINLYGPTEATVAITSWPLDQDISETTAPIGQAFTHQDVILVNDQGELDQEGEIWLGGTQVTDGYWQDQRLTKHAFIEKIFSGYSSQRWYRTGDLAVADKQLGLLFRGRKDFQLKINGFRIEPGEIEAIIHQQGHYDWVSVIPWPVDAYGKASGLVAWISGESGESSALRSHCSKHLPSYMIPSSYFWRHELPRNNNGKVDIKVLQQLTSELKG